MIWMFFFTKPCYFINIVSVHGGNTFSWKTHGYNCKSKFTSFFETYNSVGYISEVQVISVTLVAIASARDCFTCYFLNPLHVDQSLLEVNLLVDVMEGSFSDKHIQNVIMQKNFVTKVYLERS